MKKLITGIMVCLLTLFFLGCPTDSGSPYDPDPPDPEQDYTGIRFINNNAFTVSVYSDSSRQSKITDVQAQSESDLIVTSPNPNGASFYPTYQIIFDGILLPYDSRDPVVSRIDANKTTTITITSLSELSGRYPGEQLTADTYIKIQNESSSSLVLRKNNIEQILEGTGSTILNGSESGVYKTRAGPVSDYSLRKNTVDPINFPEEVTEFSAARIYTFRFDGTSLIQGTVSLLTLQAAAQVTVTGGTESAPIRLSANSWANGIIASDTAGRAVYYSFSVTNGTNYYLWWNDSFSGNSTKTLDIKVDGYYSGGSSIFVNEDSAWSSSKAFRAGSSGTVVLKVYPKTSSSTGSFAIAYTTTATRPDVPVVYTISFNLNGGSGPPPSPITTDPNSTIRLPDGDGITRTGYVFGGWNTLAAGSGTNYAAGSAYTVTGNVTLFAKWAALVTVTFDVNGGTGTVPPVQTGLSGTTITIPGGEGLAKTGYVFGGWNTLSGGTGTNYAAGADYTIPASNITLYAKWNMVYTVIYDINSGWGTLAAPQTVNSSESITLPDGTGLTRTGYVFGGWNTSSGGTGTSYAGGADYTPTGNVTLYAKWTQLYYVSFDSNGGTGTPLPPMGAASGTSITLPAGSGLSKTDFVFGGWNTKADGTGTNYNAGSTYTGSSSNNDILYALWRTNFSNSNPRLLAADTWVNGFNPSDTIIWFSINVTDGNTYYIWWNDYYDGNGKTADIKVTAYTSNGTAITGFNQIDSGWTTSKSYTATSTGTISLSVTFSNARYGSYAIAYSTTNTKPADATTTDFIVYYSLYTGSTNGIGTIPLPVTTTKGATITLPTGDDLFRPGSVFIGWYNDYATGDSSQIIPGGSDYVVPNNGAHTSMTLFAKWAILSTVTFNPNGGYGTIPAPLSGSSASENITIPSGTGLSRSGYIFDGWNTSAAGTGTNYVIGNSYPLPSSSIILYAKWSVVYTITFSANGGSGTPPAEQTFTTTSSITMPDGTGLSKTGFVFGGWNSSATGTGTSYYVGSSYSFSNSNVTLYAVWNPVYTATFNANGGSGTVPAAITGSSITAPDGDGFSRAGYVFGGWSTRTDGSGDSWSVGSTIYLSADITLYAIWYASGTADSPFMLTEDTWVTGNINTASSIYAWYTIYVSSGTTYNIWWNDSNAGNGSKTANIYVTATYENDTEIFSDENSAWASPMSFTANSNGTIKIKVLSISGGTYSIVYSTSDTRPN